MGRPSNNPASSDPKHSEPAGDGLEAIDEQPQTGAHEEIPSEGKDHDGEALIRKVGP